VSNLPPPPPIPPPPPPGDATPAPRFAAPRIRWGIGDAIVAFVVGAVLSVVVAAPFVGADASVTLPAVLIASVYGQDFGIIAWLALVARRKGRGSLALDFGFTWRPAVARGVGELKWLLIGVGIQLVALAPIGLLQALRGGGAAKQQVVKTAERAHGIEVLLIIVGVALVAPLAEELLFRGVLLRSLMRRMTPEVAVFVSAAAFGVVHAIGDPSVGTLIALPAIIALGVVSGYQAVKTGDLARSVMLHVGFNALSVILLFTT
jgi:membrane protease YdiL (CAAX protease family)